jgi:hypothetical protein
MNVLEKELKDNMREEKKEAIDDLNEDDEL